MFQFLKDKFKKPRVQNSSPMKKIKKKIFNGFIQTEKLDDSGNNSSSRKTSECYAPLSNTATTNKDAATDVTGGASKIVASSNSGARVGDERADADSLKPLSRANMARIVPTVTNGSNICSNAEPNSAASNTNENEESLKLIKCNTGNTSTCTSTDLETINNNGASINTLKRSNGYSASNGATVEEDKSELLSLEGDDAKFNSSCSKSSLHSPRSESRKYISIGRREKTPAGAPKRIIVRKAVVQRYSTFDNHSNPFIHNLVYKESKKISADCSTNSIISVSSDRPVKNSPFPSAAQATEIKQGDTFPRYPHKGSRNISGEPKDFPDTAYNIINNVSSVSSNNGRDSGVKTSSGDDTETTDLSQCFRENVELRNKSGAGNGKLIKSVLLTPYRRLHGPNFSSNGKNDNNEVKRLPDNRTCSLTRFTYHNTTLPATAPVEQNHGLNTAAEDGKNGKDVIEASCTLGDTTSFSTSPCAAAADDGANIFPSLAAAVSATQGKKSDSELVESVIPSLLPSTLQNGRRSASLEREKSAQHLYLAEPYCSKNTHSTTENIQLHKLYTEADLQNADKGFLTGQPKYKDASTNTEISLVLYNSETSYNDNNNFTNSTQNVSNYDEPNSPSGHRYKKFSKPSTPEPKRELKQSPGEETVFGNSFTTGYHRASLRQRRDWSTTRRHWPRERPRSFNEYLLSQESLYHPFTRSNRRSRIYSSINTNKGVSPNLSRYELSSRASSTDRYLDDANTRLGFPTTESSTKHDSSGRDFNGSQSFFSASEGSLFGDHPAPNNSEPAGTIKSHQNPDTRTYRIPLKSDDDDEKTETFCDSLFSQTLEKKKVTRSRCNSTDLLENDSRPSYGRDPLLQTSASISEKKSHKYHKSACNLIEDCRCKSIPSFRSVERTRSSKDVWKQSMHNNSYHLLNPLPKSKSSSGSIFLKQTVEPSKAFVYLTSIDNLDDVAEQSTSQDPLGSFNSGSQASKRTYEPLCQNCGLKGHSILKCDKISRVDKLYDVVMLGDRVSITHNEPNYVKSQKNKLPRCYYCGLRGHRSKSCNRLPAHIRQEIDPVSLSPKETTFSAYTLPRANRRARSEGRPTPTFSTTPSDHFTDILDHTDLLSPNSVATDIGFKRSDAFCSDVELGPGGFETRSLRPISMYDGVTTRNVGLLEGHPGQHGSLTKRKNKTLKIDSEPRISDAQETFQRRKTFDFDDRDSGIGYGESSSQSNLDNFPRGLQLQLDPNEEIAPISDAAPEETAGETSKSETESPAAEGKKALKKSASGNGGKKTSEKTKKKNHFLRKIACMAGRYSPQPKDQPH